MLAMRELIEGRPLQGNELLFPAVDEHGRSLGRPLTREEGRKELGNFIRDMGQAEFSRSTSVCHPQSKIGEWDHKVFAGCVERIDNYFQWTDVHWELDEPELHQRAIEWNEALEKYCNDESLVGAEREAVVAKHTASPYDPCANPACANSESMVKEYNRCSRCKVG